MRFGRNLHKWRVAAWSDYYIDYSRLKAQVRIGLPLKGLKEIIQAEADIVNGFVSAQARNIDAQILALNEHWDIEIGAKGTSLYDGVSAIELRHLKDALLECAGDTEKCHLFIKLNHDALTRIRAKVSVAYSLAELESEGLSIEGLKNCEEQLTRLNATLRLVEDALKQNASKRSLLLGRCGTTESQTQILQSLQSDDGELLRDFVKRELSLPSVERPWVLARLIEAASMYRAAQCQAHLQRDFHTPEATQECPSPKSEEYYLHKIIQNLGRAPEMADDLVCQTVKSLHSSQSHLLHSHDNLGRSPLHHAARLGLDRVCQQVLEALRDWEGLDFLGNYHVNCRDLFDKTPLDYAVENGHEAVVKALILELESHGSSGDTAIPKNLSHLLATAISSKKVDMAQFLIQQGWGLGFTSRCGKNVLHLAAEEGLSALVEDLAAGGVNIDAAETARGFTPLILASIQGHDAMAAALVEAGADVTIHDYKQWQAKDHAAYRGCMKIVKLLPTPGSTALGHKIGKYRGSLSVMPQRDPDESVIFIQLGTLDLFKPSVEVDLAPYRKRMSPVLIPDTTLSLSASLVGLNEEQGHTIPLPLTDDNSDWPWCFSTKDPDNAVVKFKLWSSLEAKPVGTAIAMLSSFGGKHGTNVESLVRDFRVPLVSNKLGHVGSVLFTFVIARPYAGVPPPVKEPQPLPQEPATAIGGHRGIGMNDGVHQLQLGENTLLSFETAMDHGADWVEFDVQLTRDDVPVIYHDWLVSEKGSDAPMHTLTYKQLMAAAEAQSHREPVVSRRLPWDERDRPRMVVPKRRGSLDAPSSSSIEAMVSQMKHTFGYPELVKPNIRGHSIHGPFLTMEELFHSMAEDVPFDIEVKYPMLSETADFKMSPVAPEINHFVDRMLEVTFAHAGPRRRVIFSSFCPEICMLLAVKQTAYPVLFLSDSNNFPTGDMRATSVQTAVRLAHRFGLAGVGMAAEPFVASPGLIGFMREQGLYSSSWGGLNDDLGNAEAQAKVGLDLLVVNRVKRVKQHLDALKRA